MRVFTYQSKPRFEVFGQHFFVTSSIPDGQWKFGWITSDSDRPPDFSIGVKFRNRFRSIPEFGFANFLRSSVFGFNRVWFDVFLLTAAVSGFLWEEGNEN